MSFIKEQQRFGPKESRRWSYYFLIAFLDAYGLGWAEFEEVLLQLRSLNNVTDQPNSRPSKRRKK